MLRFATRRRCIEGILQRISTRQRHQTGESRRKPSTHHDHGPLTESHGRSRKTQEYSRPKGRVIDKSEVIPYFQSMVKNWTTKPETLRRLASFGLPENETLVLLDHFTKMVESGALSEPSDFEFYQLARFSMPHDAHSVDVIYSTIFFWWASRQETRGLVEKNPNGVRPETLDLLHKITQAVDRSFPADEFPMARRNHRTVILHVGPTNSGKTHHALRALASAPSGVYAGPLRLLAHEIWERLNTGQILPLGVGQDERNTSISRPSFGDPSYARLCNLVTGEEQRMMGEDVPLLSCTIEMLSHGRFYDVAVVDEIQMLADPERANGWVNAVLGINAKEVHLCGEETAIPIVQELLKHTGDEIHIRRYERLSPLVVEETSLNGNLSKVKKGDCIVTFSRQGILRMREEVEEKTGMRCAVVYGRLPPEIRSEQAALFNDPNSGYDVLIGSDAVGMGLNLKIKRVIFDVVSKWDGTKTYRLPVSAVKQIAGRAGRYGLQGADGNAGGTVTTLQADDLPYLKECLAKPYEALPSAYIGYTSDLVVSVGQILPSDSPTSTLLDAPICAGRLPLILRYGTLSDRRGVCEYLDSAPGFSISERMTLFNAPIPWNDIDASVIIKTLLQMHQDEMGVKMSAIRRVPLYRTFLIEENKMIDRRFSSAPKSLLHLESLHRVAVFYLWMHHRFPVIYAEYLNASTLKSRIEKVLAWCLENLSAMKKNKRPQLHSPPTARPALSYLTKTELRKRSLMATG